MYFLEYNKMITILEISFKNQCYITDVNINMSVFVGFLLGNLPKEKQRMISTEHVCSGEIWREQLSRF